MKIILNILTSKFPLLWCGNRFDTDSANGRKWKGAASALFTLDVHLVLFGTSLDISIQQQQQKAL